MTTAHDSSLPYFAPGGQSNPTTDVGAGPDARSGRRRSLILALGVAGVAVVGVAGVQYVRGAGSTATDAPASNLANAVWVHYGFAPGGSVYNSQVPAAARLAVKPGLPGGSLYDSQVPAAAGATVLPGLPGGSLYNSQVPAAARAGAAPQQ